MADKRELLLTAFVENPVPALNKRLRMVRQRMNFEARNVGTLDPELKPIMAAGAELYASIQPERPDLGIVCLLERLHDLNPNVEKVVDVARRMRDRFRGSSSEQTASKIIDQVYIWGSFIDEGNLRRLEEQLREITPTSADSRTRIEEIAKAMNCPPETPPIRRKVTVDGGRRTDLLTAFAPDESEARLGVRRSAIRERLEVLAGMSDVLSTEGRATLLTATGYMEAIDVSKGDGNAVGKLGLLEKVLGIEPTTYFAFGSLVIARRK